MNISFKRGERKKAASLAALVFIFFLCVFYLILNFRTPVYSTEFVLIIDECRSPYWKPVKNLEEKIELELNAKARQSLKKQLKETIRKREKECA